MEGGKGRTVENVVAFFCQSTPFRRRASGRAGRSRWRFCVCVGNLVYEFRACRCRHRMHICYGSRRWWRCGVSGLCHENLKGFNGVQVSAGVAHSGVPIGKYPWLQRLKLLAWVVVVVVVACLRLRLLASVAVLRTPVVGWRGLATLRHERYEEAHAGRYVWQTGA